MVFGKFELRTGKVRLADRPHTNNVPTLFYVLKANIEAIWGNLGRIDNDSFNRCDITKTYTRLAHPSIAFKSESPDRISESRISRSAMISSGARCSTSLWTI